MRMHALLLGLATACVGPPTTVASDAPGQEPRDRRLVIVMIGDGLGTGQRDSASLFAHGSREGLFLETGVGSRGELSTASLSGTTDSAAAATTMASGTLTYNGRIGVDREGRPVESLVELAHRHGLVAGIVTTTSLPHATPAGFTAHEDSRGDLIAIAEDQARVTRPEVMLGGGARYFLPEGEGSAREDDGLLAELALAGYDIVETSAELQSAVAPTGRLFGAFASDHLAYVVDRAADTTEPTLEEMALAAIEVLDRHEAGFFLVIEAGRIDMACHARDLERSIGETLAFDDAVRAVATWANGREDVTLIVTADHETGGLDVTADAPAGDLPPVTWRWSRHTNAPIATFSRGRDVEVLSDTVRDHRWVHAVLASAITGEAWDEPARVLLPDGRLDDLRHAPVVVDPSAAVVPAPTMTGLRLDADEHVLAIGVEGIFDPAGTTAVVILVDVDFGAATGVVRLDDELDDVEGRADALLSGLPLDVSSVPGFGAELALVAWGDSDVRREDRGDDAGLRTLADRADLAKRAVATNYGDGARPGSEGTVAPVIGFEAHLDWDSLYPDLDGRVPVAATVAVAVFTAGEDGVLLPPSLPASGVVTFAPDANGDGRADGLSPPTTVPPGP